MGHHMAREVERVLLRQLKYFVSVVETGSFTEAAAQCFISQSAISQQIQALEGELGVVLLRRERRKCTLTPAGEHFYQKGRRLLEEAEQLCRETKALAQPSAPRLRIGYLRSYSGLEFHMAVGEFTRHHPEVAAEITGGNHEDLYDALRLDRVDVVLSDQRRAFSDAYVNRILTTSECYVELPSCSPLAQRESLTAEDVQALPCILVASPGQRENEKTYYRDIVGFGGEFLFADDLEQARLLVVGGKGCLPVEDAPGAPAGTAALRRVPLLRDGKPILRNYCVFWKSGNPNPFAAVFAGILEKQFR